ncbi:MAG: LysR substrate-binding domain-containing protein [Beijerinckiaceae bacterium]|jgi:DNA-binding transcriptional LysR family regulator|nr:LysR substrate-binding domain-containing protein [Beijerinckiaceae bacterium]
MASRLDLDLLRTFVMVAELGSLTRAGERLLISQPTVSLQLKRLEDGLGRSLMWRSPKGVQLTSDGETLLSYARRILALADEALGKISEPVIQGLVRLGTPEDFATTHLSGVLARFAQSHPGVALEVTTDLTLNLIERFKDGEFDLVLIKREPMGPTEGVRVWREPLVWAGTRPDIFAGDGPLPLVVSPHPCVYRKRATAALDRAGRAWRVAYTSTSLAGAQAAVRAGLGLTVLPKEMVPPDFYIIDLAEGAPDLSDTEIALMQARQISLPALRLGQHIMRSLEKKDTAH